MSQNHSERYGFANADNFVVYVDHLEAFRDFLDLAIDTILGIAPVKGMRVFGMEIERQLKRKGKIDDGITKGDDGRYYDKGRPAHYWFDTLGGPLEIGRAGSGYEPNIERVRGGRLTFSTQKDLSDHIVAVASDKDFEKDVLPHIPHRFFRGNDISEANLRSLLALGEETGHDFEGYEGIGYTIEQQINKQELGVQHHTLKIGLCKAYYPK
jgi:hypothetical protein